MVSVSDFEFVSYHVNHDDVIKKNLQTAISHLKPIKSPIHQHIQSLKRNNSDINTFRGCC